MADVTTVGLVVATSTFINSVYAVQHNRKAVVPLVAGGMSYAALAIFGTLSGRMDVALALAWLFLVGSLAFRASGITLGTKALRK